MKYLKNNFDKLRSGKKEAMSDPDGNPQHGDESKEIAQDQWDNMSKEEKEEYGSSKHILNQTISKHILIT